MLRSPLIVTDTLPFTVEMVSLFTVAVVSPYTTDVVSVGVLLAPARA